MFPPLNPWYIFNLTMTWSLFWYIIYSILLTGVCFCRRLFYVSMTCWNMSWFFHLVYICKTVHISVTDTLRNFLETFLKSAHFPLWYETSLSPLHAIFSPRTIVTAIIFMYENLELPFHDVIVVRLRITPRAADLL